LDGGGFASNPTGIVLKKVTTLPKKRQTLPKKRQTLRKAASLHKAASTGHPKATGVPDVVMPAERAPSSEPTVGAVRGAEEPIKIRESTATGNDKIEILKHQLYDVCEDRRGIVCPAYLDLAIRSVTDTTIATAIIEVTFYDIQGNVVDTAKHEDVELWPDTSRGIRIETSVKRVDLIKSYDVRITRTMMAEQERVQLRRHDINRNEAGEHVLKGVVKNISRVMADAAVVVTFYGANNVEIGRKVVVLRDIEPETIRRYELTFKPHEGDMVGTYNIAIGELT